MRSVDFAYLESFLNRDQDVICEVLTLFRGQADLWRAGLDEANPDWPAVVHTLKGAGRGVGATALGDACQAAELGGAADLPAVRAALDAAVAEIAAYLAATPGS